MKIETVKFDPSIGSQETEFSETTETVEQVFITLLRLRQNKRLCGVVWIENFTGSSVV